MFDTILETVTHAVNTVIDTVLDAISKKYNSICDEISGQVGACVDCWHNNACYCVVQY